MKGGKILRDSYSGQNLIPIRIMTCVLTTENFSKKPTTPRVLCHIQPPAHPTFSKLSNLLKVILRPKGVLSLEPPSTTKRFSLS